MKVRDNFAFLDLFDVADKYSGRSLVHDMFFDSWFVEQPLLLHNLVILKRSHILSTGS